MKNSLRGEFSRTTLDREIGIARRTEGPKMDRGLVPIPRLIRRDVIGQTIRREPIGCFYGVKKSFRPIGSRGLLECKEASIL